MANRLAGVQEGVETAFNNVQLDEKTAHEECPDDVKGAFLFKMKSGVSAVSNNANRVFRREGAYDRYDLKDGDAGIDKTVKRPSVEFTKNLNLDEFPELERPPLRKIDKYCQPECPCCSLTKRYTQAVLVMFGFIISFGIRCNVGVATVKMMSNGTDENGNVTLSEFHWSPETIGYVDASFFWGYIITQLPGGFLASRFPANRLFGTAIFLSSCLNLLIPAATKLDPSAVIVVRVIQGLVEGVTYPACHGIWRWWAPPLERSRLATLAFCGSYGGAVLGMPVSGYLAQGIGWYAPFYFYGCAGIIWYSLWLWLSFEKPSKHPSISPREQLYIEKSLGDSKAKAPTIMTTPWIKVRKNSINLVEKSNLDEMTLGVHKHASMGNHRCQLCQILDILPASHHSAKIFQGGLRHERCRGIDSRGASSSDHDHYCPSRRAAGRLSAKERDLEHDQRQEDFQLWWIRRRGLVPAGGGVRSSSYDCCHRPHRGCW